MPPIEMTKDLLEMIIREGLVKHGYIVSSLMVSQQAHDLFAVHAEGVTVALNVIPAK